MLGPSQPRASTVHTSSSGATTITTPSLVSVTSQPAVRYIGSSYASEPMQSPRSPTQVPLPMPLVQQLRNTSETIGISAATPLGSTLHGTVAHVPSDVSIESAQVSNDRSPMELAPVTLASLVAPHSQDVPNPDRLLLHAAHAYGRPTSADVAREAHRHVADARDTPSSFHLPRREGDVVVQAHMHGDMEPETGKRQGPVPPTASPPGAVSLSLALSPEWREDAQRDGQPKRAHNATLDVLGLDMIEAVGNTVRGSGRPEDRVDWPRGKAEVNDMPASSFPPTFPCAPLEEEKPERSGAAGPALSDAAQTFGTFPPSDSEEESVRRI